MPADIITAIRRELTLQADEKTKASYHHYFKEDVTFYGAGNTAVGRIAARYFQDAKLLGKKEVFRLCEEMLKADFCEEAFIACEWAYRFRQQYEPDDFYTFESWVRNHINNWAKCDTLCNHTIGAIVELYPQYINDLKQWAKSPNRWFRRAAAVTLIIPAKRGMFLNDILEIADILLTDTDDLVQKGYGWLLKDASIQHRDAIFDYVMEHKKVMPRTALRYAIERMPADLKKQAMAK
ncbi:MAG: DNA alkylation repair protein [Dehalococcoidales bacterium]|jgi:3-methyladenine DNA glycosylase AlkD